MKRSPSPFLISRLLVVLCLLGLSSYSIAADTKAAPGANTTTSQGSNKPAATAVRSGVTVNINTATAEEIAGKLKGIGQKKAEAIVAYREANGPFTSKEGLIAVKGIGESTLMQNSEVISLK